MTVYPAADSLVRGVLRFTVSLPPKPRAERTVLQLSGPGMTRRVVVLPGQSQQLSIPVDHRGPWTLDFRAPRAGYLSDGRPVSVMAKPPSFSGTYAG